MDIKRINVKDYTKLEDVVNELISHQAKGEKVYCVYRGYRLDSENITMDSAYTKVFGISKVEYDAEEKLAMDAIMENDRIRKEKEKHYQDIIFERTHGEPRKVTKEKVIKGLKFIAEHQDMEQEELLNSLLDLGCDFSIEDIDREKQRTGEINDIFLGLTLGTTTSGAYVLVNARDSESGRSYVKEKFLSTDSDSTIYGYIRTVTGDNNYTKDNIENNKSGKINIK